MSATPARDIIHRADFAWTQRRAPKKLGQPRKLKPWEASYIRRAARLRRQLVDKALAAKFGICETTLHTYMREGHK